MSGMFVTIGGTALTVLGQLKQGEDQKVQADAQAAALVNQANADAAAGQRKAIAGRRFSAFAASRAQALAAASGAGASDPTVVSIIGGIKGEGEYNALTSLYEGETGEQNARSSAQAARNAGEAALQASRLKAITTVFSGGTTLATKYG